MRAGRPRRRGGFGRGHDGIGIGNEDLDIVGPQRRGLCIGLLCGGAVAEHAARTAKPQPAGDIVRIVLQLIGEAVDHVADHRLAVLGRHVACRRHLLAGRARRRGWGGGQGGGSREVGGERRRPCAQGGQRIAVHADFAGKPRDPRPQETKPGCVRR